MAIMLQTVASNNQNRTSELSTGGDGEFCPPPRLKLKKLPSLDKDNSDGLTALKSKSAVHLSSTRKTARSLAALAHLKIDVLASDPEIKTSVLKPAAVAKSAGLSSPTYIAPRNGPLLERNAGGEDETTCALVGVGNNEGEEGVKPLARCRCFGGGLKILVVGDGDLSFSASLVSHVDDPSKDVTATVYETDAAFAEKYGTSGLGIKHKRIVCENGARLIHGVDATDLERTLLRPRASLSSSAATALDNSTSRGLSSPVHGTSRPDISNRKFDVIIFNFPYPLHLEEAQNKAGGLKHEAQSLVRSFFLSARALLTTETGEVHVSLVNRQFDSWGVNAIARECELYLHEVKGFDRHHWEYYGCRYGDERELKKRPKASYVQQYNARTFAFRRRLPGVAVEEINPDTNQVLGSEDDLRALDLMRQKKERDIANRNQAAALSRAAQLKQVSAVHALVRKRLQAAKMRPLQRPGGAAPNRVGAACAAAGAHQSQSTVKMSGGRIASVGATLAGGQTKATATRTPPIRPLFPRSSSQQHCEASHFPSARGLYVAFSTASAPTVSGTTAGATKHMTGPLRPLRPAGSTSVSAVVKLSPLRPLKPNIMTKVVRKSIGLVKTKGAKVPDATPSAAGSIVGNKSGTAARGSSSTSVKQAGGPGVSELVHRFRSMNRASTSAEAIKCAMNISDSAGQDINRQSPSTTAILQSRVVGAGDARGLGVGPDVGPPLRPLKRVVSSSSAQGFLPSAVGSTRAGFAAATTSTSSGGSRGFAANNTQMQNQTSAFSILPVSSLNTNLTSMPPTRPSTTSPVVQAAVNKFPRVPGAGDQSTRTASQSAGASRTCQPPPPPEGLLMAGGDGAKIQAATRALLSQGTGANHITRVGGNAQVIKGNDKKKKTQQTRSIGHFMPKTSSGGVPSHRYHVAGAFHDKAAIAGVAAVQRNGIAGSAIPGFNGNYNRTNGLHPLSNAGDVTRPPPQGGLSHLPQRLGGGGSGFHATENTTGLQTQTVVGVQQDRRKVHKHTQHRGGATSGKGANANAAHLPGWGSMHSTQAASPCPPQNTHKQPQQMAKNVGTFRGLRPLVPFPTKAEKGAAHIKRQGASPE
ncbi:unnamed protein product [Amoebophrya sp. A25]|nr:unnamed protein product [Amoebophrya sp. A25]|eukprot:GSA25T00017559001.1